VNVNDLRAALRERAGTVADHGTAQRVVQVHARVRGARRRRVAGAAALTVAALAAVSAVVAFPDREAAPVDHRPAIPVPPAPLPTVQHEGFVPHSGEFDLVAATTGGTGQNTLTLTVPAHAEELHVTMVCRGVSGPTDGYWVSGYAGDSRPARPHSLWCGDDPDVPAVPGVTGSAPGPWHYDDGLRLGPSKDPRTIHVELTQELDENGERLDRADETGTYTPVGHPGVVLGIGVYRVAEPVTTVAGTKIRPRVGLDGVDYTYVDHRVSKPGERTLTWTVAPSTVERYYDLVSDNSANADNPMASVSASHDGGNCQSAWSLPRFRTGGCLLSAGEPHTITVTIDPGLPENAVAGIVLYERTG
jgi:hypothetical protein